MTKNKKDTIIFGGMVILLIFIATTIFIIQQTSVISEVCEGTCTSFLFTGEECSPCDADEEEIGVLVHEMFNAFPPFFDSVNQYCNAFNRPSDEYSKQVTCQKISVPIPEPDCQLEGQSCVRGGSPTTGDCCKGVGLDCQDFQCVQTGLCVDGNTRCGSLPNGGGVNTPGEIFYECEDSSWISKGRIDGQCGYIACRITGEDCSDRACCEPLVCSNDLCQIREVVECPPIVLLEKGFFIKEDVTMPDIICEIKLFFSNLAAFLRNLKKIFAVVLGMIGGGLVTSFIRTFTKNIKRSIKLIILITSFILFSVLFTILAFIYFWWIFGILIIFGLIKALVPGI